HNPYFDNGIKFFDGKGNKLHDDVELEIEAQLDVEMACVASDQLGKAQRLPDAAGRYIEFCKATVSRGLRLRGLRIVLDCAHGATYHVAPGVFEELGADITVVGAEPDGVNINDGYGSTSPGRLVQEVKARQADVGIAFDGDGDRVLMVDHLGEIVDGDELLYIIANHRAQAGTLNGGVVGTVMTNFGLERALEDIGVPFVRAQVGDRYVLESLNERGWEVGGESSGHIMCLDLTTTGDGIVAALQALVPLVESGKTLHELKQGMSKMPQTMVNVAVPDPARVAVCDKVTKAAMAEEQALNGRGRVLIRPSGTEPVIRVMVEGDDDALVAGIARNLAKVVEEQA
ncbi:MAG: phosphoglucosamine mutase, partial [Pseudomonadales bacterium]